MRLKRFITQIEASREKLKDLNFSDKTGRVSGVTNIPQLKFMIDEIFLS